MRMNVLLTGSSRTFVWVLAIAVFVADNAIAAAIAVGGGWLTVDMYSIRCVKFPNTVQICKRAIEFKASHSIPFYFFGSVCVSAARILTQRFTESESPKADDE